MKGLDDRELQNLLELRNTHQRRLLVLEKQAASFGLHAPPHILTEIEDVRENISKIDEKIAGREKPARILPAQEAKAMDKKKILFFASNPEDVTLLNLDEEIRSITMKIRSSDYRDSLDLISRWAVRPDDLLQELNAQKPTIVHFSGHGSRAGELVLMNDLRQTKTVSPSALNALFSTLKDNIRLVVLNACYSEMQAKAIVKVIDCVVGMSTSIGDEAAISFAASFYRAIGFGRSIKEAFEQGKVSLMLEGIPEENTPVLLCRKGIDPNLLRIISNDESSKAASVPPVGDINKSTLRKSMVEAFSLEELAVACQDLQEELEKRGFKDKISMESVGGSGIDGKILNLIEYLDRRGFLGYLVLVLRRHRPGIILK